MFALHRLLPAYAVLPTRLYSQAAAAEASKHSYFVPRNSNGNLPVYSDIRSNGARYFIMIRHVDGKVHDLAEDIRKSLFKAASSKAIRAKVEVKNDSVIISGGRWKNEVTEWLKGRGF